MNFSPELITFISAMMPVTELRVSIPVAIELFNMPKESAFLYAVAGNIVPVFILLKILNPVTNLLRKHSLFADKFFEKLFHSTRKKHSKKFEMYETLFLPIFVMIPLPGSGAWTGVLIAYVFNIPYWRSVRLISLGVILAGILVTAGFTSLVSLFHVIF